MSPPTNNDVAGITLALRDCFTSPNVTDSNYEPANLVDTTDSIATALFQLAGAVSELARQQKSQADALHNFVDAYRWNNG
jgi:hypothetical protein